MNVTDYLDQMTFFQQYILQFIEKEDNVEENFQNLIMFFIDNKIEKSRHDLKAIINLLINISNNHFRTHNFFYKIEKIILYFKDEINEYFSNQEIYDLFESNMRILLFIIEEQMITIDDELYHKIRSRKKYEEYFSKELKHYKHETDIVLGTEIDVDFDRKRKIAENDQYICELIRNDSINEFINYTTQINYDLNSKISSSIYETNNFLQNEEPSLIEYGAFFGSQDIVTYLFGKKVKIFPSIWMYTVHGNNKNIVKLLEENNIKPKKDSYKKCLIESIKCFHIHATNHIKRNYLSNNSDFDTITSIHCLELGNYFYIQEKYISSSDGFYNLCKYDYCKIVEILAKNSMIQSNFKTI